MAKQDLDDEDYGDLDNAYLDKLLKDLDVAEDDSPEVKKLDSKMKSLKQIYNTDIFDSLLHNGYADYEDIGRLILDAQILTSDDREDLLQNIYAVHNAEASDYD